MKKLLLLLLCVPLIFSCGDAGEKDNDIENTEKKEENVQGKIISEPYNNIWPEWTKNINCCMPNEFYLINKSYDKKIKFTLEIEWYNHHHDRLRTSSHCRKCKYTKEDREKMFQENDTTIQTIETLRETENIFKVLSPGEKQKLKNIDEYGLNADDPDCYCDMRMVSPHRIKNYSVVGEEIIE